ncbi:hypothetical protein [Nocardia blacklockiae]|uniref:hypothetical protein n=1 Tax=Nocardia blacklockiae TaxID=480036 RepID=UPI0018945B6A|nr:hypothetical protein [Nocardia blacklockiae]MBF6170404.1 hypothetical protein [Nocardia blacklockiae]
MSAALSDPVVARGARRSPTPGERRADGDATETLSSLRHWLGAVCEAELRRLDTRAPGLDAEARAEVARAIQRVIDGLFGDLGTRVARDARLADTLRVLFVHDQPGGTP